MPYKKKYTKKRRRKRQTNLISFRKSPTPKRFPCKMRYAENIVLDAPAAGLTAVQVFDAGNLYDPNFTGVGHQPRGFDELMALYDHYVVVGSKIRVTFMSDAADTAVEHVGVALRDGSGTSTDPNDYIEGGTCRSGMVNVHAPTKTFTLNYSPKKFLGRSNVLSDPDLKGSASANSTESAFYHIFTAGADAENPTRTPIEVVIDYLCVLIEPKVPNQS